jgi:hypothetical protein
VVKHSIQRIGVFSTVRTLFVVGGVVGFLVGLLEWAFLTVLSRAGSDLAGGLGGIDPELAGEILGAGVAALGVFLPFVGGFAGAFGGALFGLVIVGSYNLLARLWGGIELELAAADSQPSVVLPGPPASSSGHDAATPLPLRGTGMTGPPPTPNPETRPDRPSTSAMYE